MTIARRSDARAQANDGRTIRQPRLARWWSASKAFGDALWNRLLQLGGWLWRRYWGLWRVAFNRLGLKRYLPRTLFSRSLMIIVTPVLLAQALATFYFYDRHWDIVTLRLSEGVVGEIAAVIDEFYADTDQTARAELFTRAARHMNLVISLEPMGTLPTQQRARPFAFLEARLADTVANRIDRPSFVNPDVAPGWAEIRIELDEGILNILVPEWRLFSSTSQVFILWMVGWSVILVIVAMVFMRNQIKPIRRLAAAADSFGKGREEGNFRLEGADEVRQAARAFLVMRNRIQRQLSQRTEMLAGVSHDLRTPLTRMKLQLAMLGDGSEIAELKADVDDMERMINGYLAFARGETSERARSADLNALIEEVCADARREGLQVRVRIERQMTLPLKPQAFRRCLGNLISNAGRYATLIEVSAWEGDGAVHIAIDDDGPGIPERMREDVFKPFFRLDPSRNQETGGAGLGLTIARDIARTHGGDIELKDSPLGGLRSLVRLPL